MIHIVFQQADVATLQKAIALDESLAGDILEIKDDFAVGPVKNIYEPQGYQQRREWWKQLLEFSPYTDALDITDDKLSVHQLIKQLEENKEEQVWIWMAQNAHDVCGYYWLVSQLKEFAGSIHVLYLNNLPFINEKGGIFYPTALYEIQPKEFLKAKKLSRLITTSEFEIDPDEWKKICDDNAAIRILEGGKKITGMPVTYFDAGIISLVTAEPQKLHKLLQTIFSKLKIKTGDVFLVWRIRQLIEINKLAATGDWNKGWKDISITLSEKTALAENIPQTTIS